MIQQDIFEPPDGLAPAQMYESVCRNCGCSSRVRARPMDENNRIYRPSPEVDLSQVFPPTADAGLCALCGTPTIFTAVAATEQERAGNREDGTPWRT